MMPIGTSRFGLRASSECVDIESNPMYAKKIVAAPAIIPSGWPPASVCPQIVFPKNVRPPRPKGAKGAHCRVERRALTDSFDQDESDQDGDTQRGKIERRAGREDLTDLHVVVDRRVG